MRLTEGFNIRSGPGGSSEVSLCVVIRTLQIGGVSVVEVEAVRLGPATQGFDQVGVARELIA